MTGTLPLVRLALRRDRLLLPAWITVITVLVTASASAIAELYPQAAQRIALGVTIGSAPALQALTGPVFDPASVGGLTAWRVTTMASVLAALMSILVVTRHVRAEEEAGRAELVGSCAVGRQAIPASAVLVASGANLLTGVLITLGLAGQGLPAAGAIAFGLAVSGTGWTFAGHLSLALAGSATILATAGLAAGLTHGLRIGDPAGQALRLLGAALIQVPATWTLAGIAMLLFGLAPRMTALAWAALLAFTLLAQLGELLQLENWIRSLSPFTHTPRALAGPVDASPLLWLSAITTMLALAGIAAFQRRDLQGS